MLDIDPPATACRVTNLERDGTTASLQRAVREASSGDRLTVQGTCLGTVHLRKDLEIAGVGAGTSGMPTLDGAGKGAVVTVKPAIAVTLRGLSIQGGGRGVLNRGSLALEEVTVLGNGDDPDGAGVYNAAGGILMLKGASSIRHNTASRAGGGVFNAGLLLVGHESSVSHNVVHDPSKELPDAGAVIDPGVATSPPATEPPSVDAGAGVMNVGVMLGAVCAPAANANVRANSPDDCRSEPPDRSE
jgi:hypothetical protein